MSRQDVFISYAHIDNEPEYEDQQGWISIFQASFRKRLSRELGRPASVFWDQRELDGNRFFDEAIRAACDDSALMIVVVSPRYVQSESCRKELDYFSQSSASRVGDRSRLITVEKTPISDLLLHGTHAELTRVMEQTLGYRFYDHDERGVRREFHIYDTSLRPRFDRKLDELVQDVAKYLQTERGQPSSPPRQASSAPPPSAAPTRELVPTPPPRVFLAATSSDARHLRDGIQLELSDKGVGVIAPSVWSDDQAGVTHELTAAVAGAQIAVHIVGTSYGSQPEGSDRAVPELQFDLVQALAKQRDANHPLICLVWLCPTADARSERQRAFVERLRSYEGWGEQDELLTGSHEELADRVSAKQDWLLAQREARQRELSKRPSQAPGDAPPFREAFGGAVRKVYVISEPEDHARAAAVERALQAESLEVLSASEITEDAATEQEREQQHQEYLEKSDAFLIYHGASKFRWVRAQADEARKAVGRRGGADVAGAVYVAQPLDGRKATYELVGIARCDEAEPEPERNLREFLVRVGAAGHHGNSA